MSSILLEQSTGAIATVLGKFMALIHNTLGIPNVTITIIILTVIIYMLMLPLTYKQQKFTKLSQKTSPEIQAIQKKYQGKTDQISRMNMNNEMQAVYDKYGISPMGSCLPLLIQMPILFAMFNVIRAISEFIPGTHYCLGMQIDLSPMVIIGGEGAGVGQMFKALFTNFSLVSFLAFMIPILSGFTQWLSVKINMRGQKMDNSNPAMSSMKTMNTVMPILSTVMVFSFPLGTGLYWVISAVVRIIQQILINMHLDRIDFDELIEKNKKKAAEKQAKREGYLQSTIAQSGRMNTRNISNESNEELLEKANQARSNARPGSMASKANLVRDYNEKNSSK